MDATAANGTVMTTGHGDLRGSAPYESGHERSPVVSGGIGSTSGDRRPLRFWQPFNSWWRTEFDRHGRRPTSQEIEGWYCLHAEGVWGAAAPSLQETRVHAKCLRSVDGVKKYFNAYRAKKRAKTAGSEDGEMEVGMAGDNTPATHTPSAAAAAAAIAAAAAAAAASQQTPHTLNHTDMEVADAAAAPGLGLPGPMGLHGMNGHGDFFSLQHALQLGLLNPAIASLWQQSTVPSVASGSEPGVVQPANQQQQGQGPGSPGQPPDMYSNFASMHQQVAMAAALAQSFGLPRANGLSTGAVDGFGNGTEGMLHEADGAGGSSGGNGGPDGMTHGSGGPPSTLSMHLLDESQTLEMLQVHGGTAGVPNLFAAAAAAAVSAGPSAHGGSAESSADAACAAAASAAMQATGMLPPELASLPPATAAAAAVAAAVATSIALALNGAGGAAGASAASREALQGMSHEALVDKVLQLQEELQMHKEIFTRLDFSAVGAQFFGSTLEHKAEGAGMPDHAHAAGDLHVPLATEGGPAEEGNTSSACMDACEHGVAEPHADLTHGSPQAADTGHVATEAQTSHDASVPKQQGLGGPLSAAANMLPMAEELQPEASVPVPLHVPVQACAVGMKHTSPCPPALQEVIPQHDGQHVGADACGLGSEPQRPNAKLDASLHDLHEDVRIADGSVVVLAASTDPSTVPPLRAGVAT